MAIRLRSAGKTDVGLKRSENEDNFIMLPDQGLYVLADGMGGHVGGKMASTLAVTLVTEFICVHAKKPGFELPFKHDENQSYEANVLANGIKYANERIFIESCKTRELEGMGTTITGILVAKDNLVVAHVGDSRVYRLRNGELTQITEDHSLLNHLINIGELKKEDAKGHANKNVILRAVGLKDYVEVSTQVVAKVPGDQYMMCSDGLSDLVDDFVIAEVMRTAPSLKDACDQLIRLALHAGGKDNITVIIAEVEEYIDDRPDRAWTTGIFSAIPLPKAGPVGAPEAAPAPPSPPTHKPLPPPPGRNNHGQAGAGVRLHAVRVVSSGRGGHAAPPPPGHMAGGFDKRPSSGSMPAIPQSQNVPRHDASMASGSIPMMPPGGYGQVIGPPGQLAQSRAPVNRRSRTPTDMPVYQPPAPEAPQRQDPPARREETTDIKAPPPGFFDEPPAPGSFVARKPAARPSRPVRSQPAAMSSGPYAQPELPPENEARPPSQPNATISGPYKPPVPVEKVTLQEVPTFENDDRTSEGIAAFNPEPEQEDDYKPTVQQMPVFRPPAKPVVDDDDSHKPTEMLLPAFKLPAPGEDDDDHKATVQHMPAFAPERPGPAKVGENTIVNQPSYRDEGSIQVDSSLFVEPEASIVVDDSLLTEVEDEDDDRRPPPPPPNKRWNK